MQVHIYKYFALELERKAMSNSFKFLAVYLGIFDFNQNICTSVLPIESIRLNSEQL